MQDLSGDPVDTLLIDVRAGTQDFAQDVAAMRATFDGTLVDGFNKAGGVLERGLVGAIQRGSLSFDDLRRVALKAIDDIAAQAVRSLFSGAGSGGGVGGLLNLGGLLGSILGLPGRATGGPVAPGQAYLVGERGPELFVPPRRGGWSAARHRPEAATCASRSRWARRPAPAPRKRCNARPARWRAP